VGTEEEYRRIIADPEIWASDQGFGFIMKMVAEQNRRILQATEARIDDETAIVAPTLDLHRERGRRRRNCGGYGSIFRDCDRTNYDMA